MLSALAASMAPTMTCRFCAREPDQFSHEQLADAFALMVLPYIYRMLDGILVSDLFAKRSIGTVSNDLAVLLGNNNGKIVPLLIQKPLALDF